MVILLDNDHGFNTPSKCKNLTKYDNALNKCYCNKNAVWETEL